MYSVYFKDEILGDSFENFDSFSDAQEFWDSFSDTPSCVAGEMTDTETGEVIWSFNDEKSES